MSPSFIFRRWFNGGKSRFLRTEFAERNWGKGEIDADLDVQSEIGMVSPSSEDFSGKFMNIVCNYSFDGIVCEL